MTRTIGSWIAAGGMVALWTQTTLNAQDGAIVRLEPTTVTSIGLLVTAVGLSIRLFGGPRG